MDVRKLADWITPLTLGALLGLYWIVDGLAHVIGGTPEEKRDYPLEIVLGLPLMAFCIGIHLLIRRIVRNDWRYVWGIEAVLVGFIGYVFSRS